MSKYKCVEYEYLISTADEIEYFIDIFDSVLEIEKAAGLKANALSKNARNLMRMKFIYKGIECKIEKIHKLNNTHDIL